MELLLDPPILCIKWLLPLQANTCGTLSLNFPEVGGGNEEASMVRSAGLTG